jgi:hypothetical protein
MKINYEQMAKDLYPSVAYKSGIKLGELVDEFMAINSQIYINSQQLVKLMAETEEAREQPTSISARNDGIQTGLKVKQDLIEKMRLKLNEMEAETVFQGENLSNYLTEFNSKKNSDLG